MKSKDPDAIGKTARDRTAYVWPMASYQLRYFDVLGAVALTRDFEAESDEAAKAYADNARGLTPMELWELDRKVNRWDAFPPTN